MATTQTPLTLTLTEKAAAEVRKFMAEEQVSPDAAGLRIAVLPGGCSGFRYSMSIEEKPADDDIVLESAGVRCFIDGFSAQWLRLRVVLHGLSPLATLEAASQARARRGLFCFP